MHGVAPQMCRRGIRLTLDREAGGRSPGLLLRGRSAVKGSPDPIGRAPCRGPLTIPDVLTMETLADVGRH
jgi:hypothetical protein